MKTPDIRYEVTITERILVESQQSQTRLVGFQILSPGPLRRGFQLGKDDGLNHARGVSSTAGSGISTGATGSGGSVGSDCGKSGGSSV